MNVFQKSGGGGGPSRDAGLVVAQAIGAEIAREVDHPINVAEIRRVKGRLTAVARPPVTVRCNIHWA